MNRFKFQWLLKEKLYFCLALIAKGYGFRGKNDWLSSQQKKMIPLAHDILCYFLCHGFSSVLLHLTQISQQTPIYLSAAWLLFLLRSMPPGWLQIFNYPQTCSVQTGAWRTYNTEDKGSVTKPFSEQKSLHTFLHYKISHSEISLEPDVHSRKHMARGRRFIFLKSSWKVIVS